LAKRISGVGIQESIPIEEPRSSIENGRMLGSHHKAVRPKPAGLFARMALGGEAPHLVLDLAHPARRLLDRGPADDAGVPAVIAENLERNSIVDFEARESANFVRPSQKRKVE
jgi:hypothetical protein